MTEEEKELVKEGLQLADDALARLMEVKNEHIAHLANLLHTVVVFGEMLAE
jgi:hypothetical protein